MGRQPRDPKTGRYLKVRRAREKDTGLFVVGLLILACQFAIILLLWRIYTKPVESTYIEVPTTIVIQDEPELLGAPGPVVSEPTSVVEKTPIRIYRGTKVETIE